MTNCYRENRYREISNSFNFDLDMCIEKSIKSKDISEIDLAHYLFISAKDKLFCISKSKDCWFIKKKNKFIEIDNVEDFLEIEIQIMWNNYFEKMKSESDKLPLLEQSDPEYEKTRIRTGKFIDITMALKKTSWKSNIMKEAKKLFYDKVVINSLNFSN